MSHQSKVRLLVTSMLAAIMVAAGAIFSGGVTQAAVTSFDVGLSGAWENPPVGGPGFGTAHFTFDDSTRVLTYALTVSGLSPDQVTASHIHRGAIGVNGPIVHPLATSGFTQISGQVTLSEDEVADLKAGNLYVNVHSKDNPGGFARGQLFLNQADALTAEVKAVIAAFGAHNLNGVLPFFTDAGFESLFQVSKADAKANPGQLFEGPAPTFVSLTDVTFDGTAAAATLTTIQGSESVQTLQTEHLDFGFGSGLWQVTHDQQIETPVPAGAKTVNVKLVDFAFDFDKSAVTGATVFHFTNAGTEEHEAVLVKLNTDKSLDAIGADLLQGGPDAPPPPYLEFINANSALPGGSFSYVFTKPLPAGRYALFCFEPDAASGQPHVALGMKAEFTVGGAGIQPPSTGDAGLKHDGTSVSYAAALAALLLVIASGSTFVMATRHRD